MWSIREPRGRSSEQSGVVGGGSVGGGGLICTVSGPDASVIVEQDTVEVQSAKVAVGTQVEEGGM